jgi:hypothetical protein
MSKIIEEYLNYMINDYISGNERIFKKGDYVEFCFEDCDRLDDDLYREEDIMKYLYVKHIIDKKENCFLKRNDCVYRFKINEYGIKCNFVF